MFLPLKSWLLSLKRLLLFCILLFNVCIINCGILIDMCIILVKKCFIHVKKCVILLKKFVILIQKFFCHSKALFKSFFFIQKRIKSMKSLFSYSILLQPKFQPALLTKSSHAVYFLRGCSVAPGPLEGIRPSFTAFCGTYRKL